MKQPQAAQRGPLRRLQVRQTSKRRWYTGVVYDAATVTDEGDRSLEKIRYLGRKRWKRLLWCRGRDKRRGPLARDIVAIGGRGANRIDSPLGLLFRASFPP